MNRQFIGFYHDGGRPPSFSIACAVFAKNAELTPVLAQGDWWHIVPSAILTCLLPDIDHPNPAGAASEVDIKTHCPGIWSSRVYA
jgi:hypothetical protein